MRHEAGLSHRGHFESLAVLIVYTSTVIYCTFICLYGSIYTSANQRGAPGDWRTPPKATHKPGCGALLLPERGRVVLADVLKTSSYSFSSKTRNDFSWINVKHEHTLSPQHPYALTKHPTSHRYTPVTVLQPSPHPIALHPYPQNPPRHKRPNSPPLATTLHTRTLQALHFLHF